MIKPLAFVLLALPLIVQAQNVRVGSKPSAVFTPTAGGYILRQPGPAHNISLSPQPVNAPSSGIPGTGAFSGGKKFRLNGNEFEMGGKYDMPLPKTGQKVPVTAISKVPKPAMAKALLKTLPFIGNAIAFGDVLDQMAAQWDAQHPETGNPARTDPATGTVFREKSNGYYELGSNKYGSAGQACNQYYNRSCADYAGDGQPASQMYPASGVDIGNGVVGCACRNNPGAILGVPAFTPGPPIRQPVPDDVLDYVAPQMTDTQMGQMLDAAQNSPNQEQMPFDLPSDLPTEVTGPASAPSSTSTTTKADGSSVTNTTSTVINYNQNTINISQQTTSTTRAADNSVTNNETTTTSNETPADPNPPPKNDPANSEPSPGLCDLYPDILACKKLDAPPEETIPKETRNIELQTGPTFAGGGCIPDVNVKVGGTSVTALAMSVPCGWISDYLKPFILLLASLSAVFIIYPKSD